MTRPSNSARTRRTVLSAIGTGIVAGVTGTTATGQQETASEYVLAQGDRCVPIQPIRGREPVRELYEYRLPDRYVSDENGAVSGDTDQYASAGTADWQRAQTSIAFLYRGPERLSLVVVHGSVDAADGGSVTFQIAGLPADGEWLVKDDLYRDQNGEEQNYDGWDTAEDPHRIDWTWGSAGTDGGAFGGLGDDFDVVVDPAFNEAAALYDEYYEGTVTDWEFLSGTDGQERISLAMDEPIRLATGTCDGATPSTPDSQQTVQQEQEIDVEQDSSADGADDGDGESRQEVKTEQEQEVETEQEQSGADDDAEEQGDEGYAVCHRPPGNPDNEHTIRVGSESALESHLDHGDSRGPCSESD